MLITDIITLLFSLFMIIRGWSRGFLGSLIGPISMMVGSLLSYVYFLVTNNLVVALCIGLILPMLLAFLLRFLLRSWKEISNPDKAVPLSILSRLTGAFLSWCWAMVIIGITVILLSMMPPINKPLERMTRDIRHSQTYFLVQPFNSFEKKATKKGSLSKNSTPSSNKDNLKSLSEDSRIQAIINDPEIAKASQNRDYAALMSNKKILALMQDPELMKKMLSVYKEMGQQKPQ